MLQLQHNLVYPIPSSLINLGLGKAQTKKHRLLTDGSSTSVNIALQGDQRQTKKVLQYQILDLEAKSGKNIIFIIFHLVI